MLSTEEAALIVNTNEQIQNESNQDQTVSTTMLANQLFATTWPLITTGFVLAGEGFAKAYIISKVGQNGLAADALLQTTFSFMVMDSTFLNPLSALIAQEHGKQNHEKIGQYVRQGWVLSIALCIPAVGVLLAAEPILNLLGQNKEITALVGPYARAYSFACPAIYGTFVDSAFLMSTLRVKSLIPFHIASALLDLGFSYAFINGKFIFPQLGVAGSGYGVLMQSWLIWLSFKLYFLKAEFNSYKLFNFRVMNFDLLLQTLRLGLPITASSIFNQVSSFLIGMMTGKLGGASLAINSIARVYLGLFVPIDIGINQASQILISQSKGKKDFVQMRRYGNIGVTIEGLINLIPVVIYAIIPIQLVSLFLSKDSIAGLDTIVRLSFLTMAISKLLLSIQGPIIGNLNGLLDTFVPAFVQIICTLGFILPLSYLLAFPLHWNIIGINTAACVGTALSIIPLLYRWHKCCNHVQELSERLDGDQENPGSPILLEAEIVPDERTRPEAQPASNLDNPRLLAAQLESYTERSSDPVIRHKTAAGEQERLVATAIEPPKYSNASIWLSSSVTFPPTES